MQSETTHLDQLYIWHPYASAPDRNPTYPVKAAKGRIITLENGTNLIDGMASWWCAIHGYNHPRLNQAATRQIEQFSHVMFGGLTHAPATKLAERLVNLTSCNLQKVFFSDSGSVSVEVALKLAQQYWHSKKETEKNKFIAFRNAYHGDTFAAMSVSDPNNSMHALFSGTLPKQYFADAPVCRNDSDWEESCIKSFERVISKNHHRAAAVIIEPILQGAGGMRVYCPEYLRQIKTLCSKYNVLLIFDEIATGFGRTGALFAYQHAEVAPDILCLGKALTGGYLSLAATMCTKEVSETISNSKHGVFMHGPTFMGNPLACSVALESITLLLESSWQNNITTIEKHLTDNLLELTEMETVKEVRIIGATGVVEMHEKIDVAKLQKLFVNEGVWVRPFSNLVYIMPAYTISESEINQITGAIKKILYKEYK